MPATWSFFTPGQLVFGNGAVEQVGSLCDRLGATRVLIITDSILEEAGTVDRVRGPLEASGLACGVFSGGEPEPSVGTIHSAAEAARAFEADAIIGLGGGSNMDLAKAVATLLAHGGSIRDYAGDQVVPGPVGRLVLIPTTAGTGSEITAASVLSDPEKGTKFAVLSNHLRPDVALVDPELTATCPPSVTAHSGIDALTHAVEAFTAIEQSDFPLQPGEQTVYQGRSDLTNTLAARAIALVGEHLRTAVSDGANAAAREGMALAATTAGLAFSNSGVAVVHALEFSVARITHIPHGCGCGLLLPYVMKYNAPADPARIGQIAALLGEDVNGMSEDAAADRAVEVVQQLKADIDIPIRLSEVGVKESDLAGMAEQAFALKRILRVNPRYPTQQDLHDILQAAL